MTRYNPTTQWDTTPFYAKRHGGKGERRENGVRIKPGFLFMLPSCRHIFMQPSNSAREINGTRPALNVFQTRCCYS